MQMKFRRLTALLMALVLLLSAFPVSAAAGVTPNGEYSVPFLYVKDGSNERSIINDYLNPSTGKLIITNGSAKFQHEVTQYTSFHHFSAKLPGKDKAVINGNTINGIEGYQVVAAQPAGDGLDPDHVVVSYDIENMQEKQEILIHIVIPSVNYDNWYNVQLQLDISGLPVDGGGNGGGGETGAVTLEQLEALFTTSNELLNTTTEGTGDGFYLLGSKATFQNTITQARSIADSAGGSNQELIKAAYLVLQEGKKKYEAARLVVNKANLVRALEEISAFATTVKNIGTANGASAAHAVLTDGEYSVGASVRLGQWITEARAVAGDPQVTQTAVNNTLSTLTAKVEDLKYQQFKKEVLPLLVLDPETGEKSEFSKDFKTEAIMFTQLGTKYFNAYSHVVFAEVLASEPLMNLFGQTSDGKVSSGTLNGYETPIKKGEDGLTAYQLYARHELANDSIYQGLSKLEYSIGTEKRTVLFSYNANLLNALNSSITAARKLHDSAVVGTATGQYEAAAKESLLSAIQLAEQTGKKLNSTRPEITNAAKILEKSVQVFKGSQIRNISFAALHATNAALSSMDSYFLKPASVTSNNGETYVSFSIKDSSIVTEFKVAQNSILTDVTVVSENKTENTRVIKFKVDDLTAIVPGQVRIIMPNVIDPRTGKPYDATHNIRLLLDNGDPAVLKAAIAAAKAAHDGAAAGTGAGQYPQSAKDTLLSAITAANAVANSILSTKQQLIDAEGTLDQALRAFQATKIVVVDPVKPTEPGALADGKYLIDIQFLKQGTTQTSVMDEYVAHPARLLVQNGVKLVQVNLKQSKEITGFTIGGSTPTTIESDASANTRRVQFTVADLPAKLDGWVKIDWPEVKYHHEYSIQIQLGAITPVASWDSDSFGSVVPRETPEEIEKKKKEQEEKDKLAGKDATAAFKDLANNWAKDAINRALKLNIVQGYPDGSFKPNATVNRVEWTVILGRALKLEGKNASTTFADMKNIPTWAQSFIEQAVAAGIINGYEDQTFRPTQNVNRTEIAVMIVRALHLPLEAADSLNFADAAEIPSYAKAYIATAVKYRLIKGLDQNQFGGTKSATRAEAITLVLRAVDYLEAKAAEQEKAKTA
ncbi:NEAT domain-containing protein [Paenibacillus sp. NRS-1760]|uniref:NEAT domain-containing protein n=1 Tax=Paenibacillus sp. NRS-1760 TaxID=3233902 RepID=UPI003D2749A9